MRTSRVFIGALQTVGAQILSLLVALACVPILLARLGSEGFGSVALCISALAAMNFANIGLGPVASREIAAARAGSDGRRARSVFSNTTLLLIVPAVLVGAAVGLGADEIAARFADSGESRRLFSDQLSVLGLVLPAALLTLHVRSSLEGVERFGASALLRVASNAAFFVFPVIAVLAGEDPASGFLCLVPLLLLLSLYGLSIVRVSLSGLIEPVQPGELVKIARRALSYASFSGSQLVLLYGDRYVVGGTVGLGAAGVYAAVCDIATRINLIYGTFTQPLMPAFSAWIAAGDDKRIGQVALLFASFVQRLLLLAGAGALVVSPFFFEHWLGSDAAVIAVSVFPWVLFAFAISGQSAVPQRLLLAHRADARLSGVFTTLAIVFLPLAFVAAKTLGLEGVCVLLALRGLAEFAWVSRLGLAIAPESERSVLSFVTYSGAGGLIALHGAAVLLLSAHGAVASSIGAASAGVATLWLLQFVNPASVPGWRMSLDTLRRREWA